MKAIAIDQFGDVNELKFQTLQVPKPASDEVLIRIDTAGVGVWDPPDREGSLAKMRDSEPDFPYILGRDGAGIIVAVGEEVTQFGEGDRVYAFGPPDPQANLYAEYATEKVQNVAPMPETLSFEEAGALATDAVTALCGLDQVLNLQAGETLVIFGASGGLGHLALQLAKRMDARVFAVASGEDGLKFVNDLGANGAINGHNADIAKEARAFAPDGFDAALLTVGGEAAVEVLKTMRKGGRAAYPNGVDLNTEEMPGIKIQAYNGQSSPEIFEKLNRLIDSGPFRVHIAHLFPLEKATEAHQMLDNHFLGRIALKINDLQR